MFTVHKFNIVPSLPEKLLPLKGLAYDLFWVWSHEAFELFRRMDRELWEESRHNPVKLLGSIKQEKLEKLAQDDGFVNNLERVLVRLDSYRNDHTWYQKKHDPFSSSHAGIGEEKTTRKTKPKKGMRIAYFSAEFGLTECIPIYSGGLGVLAGDHLKSASDMGIPLVGVGLLYQQGYFRQYLNADGWQMESYPDNDFFNMPMSVEKDKKGKPIVIGVEYPGRVVHAKVWRIQVGRVPLFLLDTNIPENSDEDKNITYQLYGGDKEMRMKQEVMLGIGGMHALHAIGLEPDICHMNEGHSAFLAIERIRRFMNEKSFSFNEAKEATTAGNVFTTHTPVPAGIDTFSEELIDKYLGHYYPALGISREEFMGLGRVPHARAQSHEPFNMAILALNTAVYTNGVSKLHGKVARKMWQTAYPGVPVDEVPITSITNGIHIRSWISQDMAGLFYRYLGHRWADEPTNSAIWERVEHIPNEELWRTHERRRERLVAFARKKLREQLIRRGEASSDVAKADEVLNPDALTIGFARRFATYKRGTLLLSNIERLGKILNNKEHPVQIIFAGKAHPHDNEGKRLIKDIVHAARSWDFRHRMVFLEDYDIAVAKYLVQGVDVWLNTPRMYHEASGTSGMKVCPNGGLNLSILDGWWYEGFDPNRGWSIGKEEEYTDYKFQDRIESNALYDLLEKEIVPLFYKRGKDDLPRHWIYKVKSSMKSLCPEFRTGRMVYDYTERFYVPAGERYADLLSNKASKIKTLAKWKQNIRENWSHVKIVSTYYKDDSYPVGTEVGVVVDMQLGSLVSSDILVQIFYGEVNSKGDIKEGKTVDMAFDSSLPHGVWRFKTSIPCNASGQHGYGVRVLPYHKDMGNPFEMGLIIWEN